jgi:hypothetical protein
VGAIANAGKMISPDMPAQTPSPLTLSLGSSFTLHFPSAVSGGPTAQRAMENARIPMYLGADWMAQLPAILDYEDWPSIFYAYTEQGTPSLLDLVVEQDFPLKFPLHRAFYADDSIRMVGRSTLENHYPLYLDVE